MFRKDSSVLRPSWGKLAKKGTLPPHPSAPPDPLDAPELHPMSPIQGHQEKAYRGMLLLPMKHFPESLDHPSLADKEVIDILPLRTPDTTRRSKERVVFDSDSAIRQVQIRERRHLKERKADRDRRSLAPGYLEMRAPQVLEEMDNLEILGLNLREAARQENRVLELRTQNAAQRRWTWSKDGEQSRAELEAKIAMTTVQPLPWVRPHHPQLPLPNAASSSDSTYSRRSSMASSIRSLPYRDSSRDSILTVSTRYSSANVTARSSMMSVLTLPSSIGSPVDSRMPSPTLSFDFKNGKDDIPRGFDLPSPVGPGYRLGQIKSE